MRKKYDYSLCLECAWKFARERFSPKRYGITIYYPKNYVLCGRLHASKRRPMDSLRISCKHQTQRRYGRRLWYGQSKVCDVHRLHCHMIVTALYFEDFVISHAAPIS